VEVSELSRENPSSIVSRTLTNLCVDSDSTNFAVLNFTEPVWKLVLSSCEAEHVEGQLPNRKRLQVGDRRKPGLRPPCSGRLEGCSSETRDVQSAGRVKSAIGRDNTSADPARCQLSASGTFCTAEDR
jgi:hypothetical protein